MKRKLQNTTTKIWSISAIAVILIVWQSVCSLGMIDSFLLPSPVQVVKAFVEELPVLMEHSMMNSTVGQTNLFLGLLLIVINMLRVVMM